MKKKTGLIVLFFMAALLVSGCLGGSPPAAEPQPPQAEEPAEPAEANRFAAGDFQNPSGCGSCHAEIYQAWLGSMHAAAWTNVLYQPDYLRAFEETDGATDIFCGECHAPVAVRTGQLPPVDGSAFDAVSTMGVSCDYCHTVSEVIEPVNVMANSAPGQVKRGPRGDTQSPAHQTAFSELHTQSEFCGACHNVRHPFSGATVIDTYDDWLAGPYAEEGIRCQDCHMTPGPGVGKNPGKSSIMGNAKDRDHIATHFFVGGSSWMLSLNGFEEHARMAEENLKSAATMDLAGEMTANGLDLTVTVNNVGAGHKIPTGVTYIRKMWLEVTVENEKGETVFVSGHADADNNIDPDAVFFRKLFVDADGQLTSKSWLAEGIGYDRRIPAKGSDSETYSINAEGSSYTATVRLLYRSTTQAAADMHFAGQDMDVPSIEMAKATITIK